MVRVYPGAKRQDSSNIDPDSYWAYGKKLIYLKKCSIFQKIRRTNGGSQLSIKR